MITINGEPVVSAPAAQSMGLWLIYTSSLAITEHGHDETGACQEPEVIAIAISMSEASKRALSAYLYFVAAPIVNAQMKRRMGL